MSFELLKEHNSSNKALLLKIAEEFGTAVHHAAKCETIVNALIADGIDWDAAKKFVPDAAVKNEAFVEEVVRQKVEGPQDLLKMTRKNFSYETRGVKFTKEHPFAIVNAIDAEWIVENEDGFSYATPKEAAEYYS